MIFELLSMKITRYMVDEAIIDGSENSVAIHRFGLIRLLTTVSTGLPIIVIGIISGQIVPTLLFCIGLMIYRHSKNIHLRNYISCFLATFLAFITMLTCYLLLSEGVQCMLSLFSGLTVLISEILCYIRKKRSFENYSKTIQRSNVFLFATAIACAIARLNIIAFPLSCGIFAIYILDLWRRLRNELSNNRTGSNSSGI